MMHSLIQLFIIADALFLLLIFILDIWVNHELKIIAKIYLPSPAQLVHLPSIYYNNINEIMLPFNKQTLIAFIIALATIGFV
jgi:hypothetical protein